MKLLFEIEYRTRWGEQLVLFFGRRRIALQYHEGGIWKGAVERYTDRTPVAYRYAVERDGACIRTEWQPHTLRLPEETNARAVRIRDRWQEMPADASFYSSAFTRGIFARPEAEKKGAARRAKTARTLPANGTLRLTAPALLSDETLALASDGIDTWQRIVPLDDSRFPEWELPLRLPRGSEYKLLIADRKSLEPILWEEGANRTWNGPAAEEEYLIEASVVARFPERRWRGAGTAVPVFSLRSHESFGGGEFADLKLLIDWAAATRQRGIQLLPINDTTKTGTWEDSYP